MPFADRAELLRALRSVDAVVGFGERDAGGAARAHSPRRAREERAVSRRRACPNARVVLAHGGEVRLAPHRRRIAARPTSSPRSSRDTDRNASCESRSRLTVRERSRAGCARCVRRLYERDPDLEVHLFLRARRLRDRLRGAACAPAVSERARLRSRRRICASRSAASVTGPAGPRRCRAVSRRRSDARASACTRGWAASRRRTSSRSARIASASRVSLRSMRRTSSNLRAWRTPAERIERVGNLAIDGALLEAQQPLEAGRAATTASW